MRAGTILAAAALLVTGTAAACTGGQPAAPSRLVIAAGGPADVYTVLAEALAEAAREAWSAEVSVPPTRGSVENLQMVAEGRADVGFATIDVAAAAINGEGFATGLQLRALGRLYDDYLHVVTLAGSGIDGLADLAGRRVSVGPRESGNDIAATRVLTAANVNPEREDDSPTAAARALAQGEIDAFFVVGGLPTPVVSDLATTAPINLLSMPDLVDGLQAQFPYYQAGSIPAGTYGLAVEVATVTVANVLVVRPDMPDDVAYRLTELLFDAKPELVRAHEEARRLDRRAAPATFPVTLHDGAQRYYRDSKPFA
jgi:uncharacterized protein